jgi:hypothetical protein
MGPPKILSTDAGWNAYSESLLPGLAQPTARAATTANGQSIFDTAAGPSWYPYYYRVDAIGPDDPANGVYSGWSLPSHVQSAYCEPPDPPLIGSPLTTGGGGAVLIVLQTDLPIPPSPLGPSLVELLGAGPDPANPGQTLQTTLLSAEPATISQATLSLPHLSPNPQPQPVVPHPLQSVLARSAPDASGHWSLSALVPTGAPGSFTLRLTDPLGRQSSTSFPSAGV